MESVPSFNELSNSKFYNISCSNCYVNINNKRNGKNYSWSLIFLILLLNISLSFDYFPRIIETNNETIVIPLFTNQSDKKFKIIIDGNEFHVDVKRCIITYFTYNFSDFKLNESKKIIINDQVVLVRFVENPRDYYDELFEYAYCSASINEILKKTDAIDEIIKNFQTQNNASNFFNNYLHCLTCLVYIAILLIIIIVIYIFKEKLVL